MMPLHMSTQDPQRDLISQIIMRYYYYYAVTYAVY